MKTSGRHSGKADYKKLYWNYATGWMVIDVASVLPIDLILSLATSTGEAQTGDELKALKTLRLIRLLKLLRLARGMRLFKKHEDKLGPILGILMMTGMICLSLHAICCVWYLVGAAEPPPVNPDTTLKSMDHEILGWVEEKFQGTERYCACHGHDGTMHYDTFDRVCVNRTDYSQPVLEVCEDRTHVLPTPLHYYYKSMFTAVQEPFSDTASAAEIVCAMFATILLGYLWGAVAGAWSTIFASNQMASQAYKMKLREVKEFCKIKQLDWGARAKLTAHYEYLYPEQVIVDEKTIIDELPPRMKEELIRELYGQVISSVPLFFGLDSGVLTELCLALVSVPALKGQAIVRQGCKYTGDLSCRCLRFNISDCLCLRVQTQVTTCMWSILESVA